MSLHVLANHMATKGRGSDSMLVHMTPEEVASLQALAMKNGGSLTINPDTGLPEAGFLKSLLPAIAGFALNAFLPGVGTAIGGALGTSAAVGTGIAVGGITGLATGSLSKGLMAGLGAYGGAGLADSFMGVGAGAGLNNALANAGTAEGAQGQAFNEFLKSEANPAVMSSTDKLAAGFNAVKEAPGAFLKDNWKMGLAAASPFIADAMVPTTVKAPNAQSTGYIRPFQFDENTRTVRAMDPVLASEWGARQFPDYIRKSQTTPPAGMGAQLPPGMARGGIVALADGGETDPYARFNTLSGQSKDAYDYLMGNIQRVPAADLTTPTRPVVSNTNTVPTTGGGGDGGGGTGRIGGIAGVGDDPVPVMPSPDEDFPSTYPQPVMPSPDEDFPSTYPQPVMPDPYVSDPYNPNPVFIDPFVPEPAPAREPVDASYWSNPGQDEVGPSIGLRKNQEELPEEFDKYLKKDDDELGYLTGNRPELTPEPAQDIDPNFFEPGYGNTGVPEPTEYEVQPWENVNNPGTGSMAGDNSLNSGNNTYTGTTSEPSTGLPDAFGSYPGEPTYIGPTEVIDGGGSGGRQNMIEVEGDAGFGDEDHYDYMGMARGGLTQRYAMGGLGSLGGYSDGGRLLKGPGDGVSDSIPATIGNKRQPARLADGEFVVPARIVSELGNGSTEAGARKLYAMMDRIQKARGKTVGKGKVAANSRSDKHLPA
jgi:hypothetical protein